MIEPERDPWALHGSVGALAEKHVVGIQRRHLNGRSRRRTVPSTACSAYNWASLDAHHECRDNAGACWKLSITSKTCPWVRWIPRGTSSSLNIFHLHSPALAVSHPPAPVHPTAKSAPDAYAVNIPSPATPLPLRASSSMEAGIYTPRKSTAGAGALDPLPASSPALP